MRRSMRGTTLNVFDEKGFEWSYEGSAPRQLALAMLVDHLYSWITWATPTQRSRKLSRS